MAAFSGWCSFICVLLLYIQLRWLLRCYSYSTDLTDGLTFNYLDHISLQIWSWRSARSQLCFNHVLNTHRSCAFICSLLFLCGDVHANPGPIEFPCGICKKSVNSNHRALLCDLCNFWHHIRCARVSSDLYSHYLSLSQFAWHCPTCLFNLLPDEDVFNDLDESMHRAQMHCMMILLSLNYRSFGIYSEWT